MSEIMEIITQSKSIVACSNDAGGAEVLSSFLENNKIDARYIVDGPATNIYIKKFVDFKYRRVKDLPLDADLLLSSTGWSTNFEFDIIEHALSSGRRVIAVLDHWSAYRSRFERNNKKLDIHEILVFDKKAEILAKLEFPNAKIYLEDNPYLKRLINAFHKYEIDTNLNRSKNDFIYLCEPRAKDLLKADNEYYSDYESLEYFFKVLSELNLCKARIVLRPHPSEKVDKYVNSIPPEFSKVYIDKETELPLALLQSNYVVGCNTMAMIAALCCGKKVYSSVPPPHTSDLEDERILRLTKLRDEMQIN